MYQAFVCTSQPLQQNLEVVEQCIQRNFAAEVGKILKFVAAVAWAYMATDTWALPTVTLQPLMQGKAAAAASCTAGGLGVYYLPLVAFLQGSKWWKCSICVKCVSQSFPRQTQTERGRLPALCLGAVSCSCK